MSNKICAQEERVVRAVIDRTWDDRLAEHVDSCARCGKSASAARWMSALAESAGSEASFPDEGPDEGLVWVRAQLEQDLARKKRLLRPLALWGYLVQTGPALALGVWVLWNEFHIQDSMGAAVPPGWNFWGVPAMVLNAASPFFYSSTPGLFLGMCIVLVILTVHPPWSTAD